MITFLLMHSKLAYNCRHELQSNNPFERLHRPFLNLLLNSKMAYIDRVQINRANRHPTDIPDRIGHSGEDKCFIDRLNLNLHHPPLPQPDNDMLQVQQETLDMLQMSPYCQVQYSVLYLVRTSLKRNSKRFEHHRHVFERFISDVITNKFLKNLIYLV